MTLIDNPFARLGATPADPRRVLADKADEAALLGGGDADDALDQLMQLNRRVSAELAWFPGATRESAQAFLDFAVARAEGQNAPIPPVDDLGTPLAQANALSPLFEAWPADSVDMTVGLCLAMDAILGQVTASETLEAVNADRRAGQWEPVADAYALRDPLDARLRQLCAPITRAMDALNERSALSVLNRLLDGGIEPLGYVVQAVVDAYTVRIHERAEALSRQITADTARLAHADSVTMAQLSDLRGKVRHWCELTAPLRRIPGEARNRGKSIAIGVRNVLGNYLKTSRPIQKEYREVVRLGNTRKVFTVNYHSQEEYIRDVLEFTAWLKHSFAEQEELRAQFASDETLLNDILLREKANVFQTVEKAKNGQAGE